MVDVAFYRLPSSLLVSRSLEFVLLFVSFGNGRERWIKIGCLIRWCWCSYYCVTCTWPGNDRQEYSLRDRRMHLIAGALGRLLEHTICYGGTRKTVDLSNIHMNRIE